MSADISLLPEGLRKKEETLKGVAPQEPPKEEAADMHFFIPKEEGEDIEVIEVDEGELDQVLAGEPTLTKFAFYATNLIDDIKSRLFKPKPIVAPPKVPPQFFKAPPVKPPSAVGAKPGAPSPAGAAAPAMPAVGAPKPEAGKAPTPSLLTMMQAPAPGKPGGTGATGRAKAQIAPFAVAPRRVRVIKRVRKPVRVSFVSEEETRLMHVDVKKRRFTFIIMTVLFIVLLAGGYELLDYQRQQAQASLDQANAQLAQVNGDISEKLKVWSSFQNLEPKLKALAGLLDQHVSPTQLLDDLENNTLPTVSYDTFSLATDGKVTLSVTADSLETAAKQVLVFQTAPFVKTVDASNYAIDYNPKDKTAVMDVKFQVVLTLADDAMRFAVNAPQP